jgi:Leucine-rich repeat (LRR) protein
MNKPLLGAALFIVLGAGCATMPPPDATTPSSAAAPATPSVSGQTLDLSGRGLTKVPENVFGMTGLVTLDLSDNALTGALPGEIRHLKSLKVLDVSGNAMTGVPAEVGQLEDLETLDLSDNKLTGLPLELGNLKRLKTLDLSGNPYSAYDLDLIRKMLPDTRFILE